MGAMAAAFVAHRGTYSSWLSSSRLLTFSDEGERYLNNCRKSRERLPNGCSVSINGGSVSSRAGNACTVRHWVSGCRR